MLLDSVVNLDIEHQLELLASLRWRDERGGKVSGPSGILKGVSPNGAKACETRSMRLPV